MDNDVLAYRVLLEKRKENAPFWEKKVLTVEEAAEYTGIGRTKIRQIIMRGDCPFAVTNGVQVCVIRDKFIDYLDKQFNDEQLLKDENAEVLLPHFSCHSLRHTFTTRMCEAGVNVKVIQDTLGHKDISTTLNIYTDVTKELRKSEFEGLDSYFKNEYNKVSV